MALIPSRSSTTVTESRQITMNPLVSCSSYIRAKQLTARSPEALHLQAHHLLRPKLRNDLWLPRGSSVVPLCALRSLRRYCPRRRCPEGREARIRAQREAKITNRHGRVERHNRDGRKPLQNTACTEKGARTQREARVCKGPGCVAGVRGCLQGSENECMEYSIKGEKDDCFCYQGEPYDEREHIKRFWSKDADGASRAGAGVRAGEHDEGEECGSS